MYVRSEALVQGCACSNSILSQSSIFGVTQAGFEQCEIYSLPAAIPLTKEMELTAYF